MTRHKQVMVYGRGTCFEVDEGIAPLIERLLKLGISTINSCEDNIPEGWVWLEFAGADDAERFLHAVSYYILKESSLQERIFPVFLDNNDNWRYKVNLNSNLQLLVSVRFPRSDLGEILQNWKTGS